MSKAYQLRTAPGDAESHPPMPAAPRLAPLACREYPRIQRRVPIP